MKFYQIYIKSHSIQPDYEDWVEATSREDAVEYFVARLTPQGWGRDEVAKRVYCEEECPQCYTTLEERVELREGGYSETMEYCVGCGWTGVQK